ncbi:regucalcin-like [Daktulosphaira vitifoliae]|uniref:regucalcin-like n=1 Tax=Daktulosphaira vitifoliae TaxID=58002 RepID=UPI0021AA098F|nr:regucalcin-like [Daktulosphaira vitifoliae]XP_050534716.1 regucalcin-like [Daktulosphaira vitifoliae]
METISKCSVNYDGAVIKSISNDVMVLGEGPFWDSQKQIFYFVDIMQHRVYRFKNSKLEFLQLDTDVGFIIPVAEEEDLFVIGLGTELTALKWSENCNQSYSKRRLITVDENKVDNRWNDAKADHAGFLYAGTMARKDEGGNFPPNQGTLYKLSDSCQMEAVVSNVSISNGMAWNNDGTKMYYIDSLTKQIALFDYDPKENKLANRRVFYDFKTDQLPGFPDGMTIDENDNLWVANYGGAQVIHICGHTGKLLGKLALQAELVSSVTFGGPELDILYVTTISEGESEEQFKKYPKTGKVLEVTGLGVKGTLSRRVKSNCFRSLKF